MKDDVWHVNITLTVYLIGKYCPVEHSKKFGSIMGIYCTEKTRDGRPRDS